SPAAFTNITSPTGGNGTFTYQWQVQPACTGGWSDISGATASTYDVTGNITQTTCYRRLVTSGICGTLQSNVLTVTVYSDFNPGSIGYNQSICYDSIPLPFFNISTASGGSGIFTYQWQIQPGCSGTWSNISGATLTTYHHNSTLTQTTCFRRFAINTCSSLPSNPITVTVFPYTPVSFTGLQAEYCTDASPVLLTGTPTGGSFSGIGISGNIFYPNIAGAGTFTITYTYFDPNGCMSFETQQVTVYNIPIVSFSGLLSDYCIDASPATLTGTPSGGTFSGQGIIGNTFNPSSAGAGTFTITYTYIDGNTCTNSYSQTVNVHALPLVGLLGLSSGYCVDDAPVTIIGLPQGGTFSGPGMTGNLFDPSSAGVGVHWIYYTYTDIHGCTNFNSQMVDVFDLPVVSFSGLLSQYCISALPSQLIGSPSGGTFTGQGVVGNYFYPNIAGTGTFNIIYTYQDGNNCFNQDTQSVSVYAQPLVSFYGLGSEYCIDASPETLTGVPAGGYFSGPGITGNVFNPSYAGSGSHTITYYFTDINGCSNSYSQTVIVYDLPAVFFSGLNNGYCIDAPVAQLIGNPPGGYFTGNGLIGNFFNPILAGVGIHSITYHYTDIHGCYDSISQNVEVYNLPNVTFTGLASNYCPYDASVLTGIPAGGTFSGPGVMGNIFHASMAGVGTHHIVYTYIDNHNCLNTDTQTTAVSSLVSLNISGILNQYCIDDLPVTIVGMPTGGTFTGAGISGNIFTPGIAGIGSHTIEYTYTDSLGCINSTSHIVSVYGLPNVTFFGLDTSYCIDATPALLTGFPSGGTFSGAGILGNSFNPSIAGLGTHTITYLYNDSNSCMNSYTRNVIVNPLPVVTITNLLPEYCFNNPPIPLTGIPVGGTFSGIGVNGNFYYPSVSGVGTFSITYTYEDANGCINSDTQALNINPIPVINSPDSIATCSGQSVNYNITSNLSGTNYTWSSTLILGSASGYTSGSGTTINDVLINNTMSAAIVKYVITPTTTGIPSCTGSPFVLLVYVRPYPTLFAGDDALICSNVPYFVNDATTDSANAILWTHSGLGTFDNDTIMNPTYIPSLAESGSIMLYMTVTNPLGCPKTDTMELFVDFAPIADAGGDQTLNCGGAGMIIGTAALPNYVYNWQPALGLSNPNTAQPNANPISTTTYILFVTDTINGCFDYDTVTITITGAPTVDAGVDQSINCGGSGVTIGTSGSAGFTYNWNPTNSLSDPNIAQPIATPLSNTTYVLSVTDLATGCLSTDEMTVTVIGAPIADAGPDQSISCGGNTGVVIGSSAVAGMIYNWQPTSGLSNPNIAQPTANPLSSTVYVLTVTDSITGCFATDEMVLTAIGSPIADAGLDQSINCGISVAQIGTSGISGLSYNWLPANGLSDPNIAQPTASPSTNTSYILVVTDLVTGCYATDEVNITVIGAPFADAGTDQSIQCGATGIIIGSPALAGLAYNWSPSSGLSNPNIAQPTATPLGTTTYIVTVTDLATGCYTTDNVTISVIGAPTANAGLDISLNCGGSGSQIGTPAISGLSYNWLPAIGLNNPNIAQPSATPLTNTTYTLIVTDLASGCYATDEVFITVIGAPLADAGSNQTIGCGGPGTTIGSSALSGMTYSWSPSYALSATNVAQPTATPLGNTTYYLTVTNTATGCYGVDSVTITVAGAPIADAGVDQSVNCGGSGVLLGTTSVAGMSYTWAPSYGLDNPNIAQPTATPLGNTIYYLTVTDIATGCFGTDNVSISVTGTPIADAGVNQSIPCGGPGVLIGTSAQTGVSYLWNPIIGLDDNTLATPLATPYATTNYFLTVSDLSTGCFATDMMTITVAGLPSVNAGPDATVCANDTFMITGATSSNAFVQWTHNGIGNLQNFTNVSPTYFPLPNEYGNVTLTLTAVCNSDTANDDMVLTIYPYPIASFSELDSAYCIDNPGDLLIGYPTGGTFSGLGINGNFFSPASAGSGIHNISYIYTDANGCTKDTSKTTIVNPLPVVSFTGLNSHYCIYDASYLIGTPSGGTFSGPGMVNNFFYPSISGIGTFNITYSYLDANGCINSQTQQTTVTPLANTDFTGLLTEYCVDHAPDTLIGIPSGGIFVGPGILGNVFYPSLASIGSHSINYEYTDSLGCVNSISKNVTVHALPTVIFSGLDSAYCIDATPAILTGYPNGGTFTGNGININIFNPFDAGSGIHSITYTYIDSNTCVNSFTSDVEVFDLPVVTLDTLNAVCEDVLPFSLYGGLPLGGTYTGNGVNNNMFHPNVASVGTHIITYTYLDSNSCVDFATQSISVNPLPIVSFTGLATYYCISNDTILLTGTPSGGTFTGNGIINNGFNPSLAGVGMHQITYTYTDGNSCTSMQTQTVEVKALPVVDFYQLATEYCIDGAIVSLTGVPGGGIFSGNGISNNLFNPALAGVGTHVLTYTYTDTFQCVNHIDKSVIVHSLPVVTLDPLSDACPNTVPFQLSGGMPLGGTYSGTGVANNTFNPSIAGVGSHTITYTYLDSNSCENFATQILVVNPLPVLSIIGLDLQYCYNALADTITGSPSGGYFFGQGMTNNVFIPADAGVGMHIIAYVYTDSSSCTDTTYQNVNVLPLPVVSFGGLDSAYCVNYDDEVLYGFQTGGFFSGTGISGNIFSPSTAGIGIHDITYTFTDSNMCTNSLTSSTIVHNLPVVLFDTLSPICVDAQAIILNTGSPIGGTYSGTGVINGIFDPAIAGVGTHTLIYAYTDSNSCVNSASQTILVNPLPIVSFTGLDNHYCFNAASDSLTGIPAGGFFSGNGIYGDLFMPDSAGVGTHSITYTYTDTNGCVNSYTETTEVMALPVLSVTGLDTSYCINSSPVYIYGNPAGGTFTGAGISGNIFDPVAAGIGIFEIVYSYTDFYGCTNNDTTVVVVNDLTVLTLFPVNPVCIDVLPFPLQFAYPVGGSYSGQGVINGYFDPQLAGAGQHTINYDYIDNNNCLVNGNIIITVFDLPVVELTLPLYEMCSNDSIIVLNGGTPLGGTFSGNGVSSYNFDPNIAGAGLHTITYTYTDTNACTSSDNSFIYVNQAPLGSAGDDISICKNASITLTASGGDYYIWSTIETTKEIIVQPLNTTTYTVTVYDSDNGCSETDDVVVTIIPLPEVELIIDFESDILSYGQYVTFLAVPSTYEYYDFYINSVLKQSGVQSTFSTNVFYADTAVSVIALDGTCMSEPYTIPLNVKPIFNAFTPNGDGKNDIFMKGHDMTILNRWGQVLYEGFEGWDGNYDGEAVPEGTYFYVIRFKDSSNTVSVNKGSVTLSRSE
ncbi:MAG: gliding motility-associated C-terminal domain-containing protein, partial [Bacteroidales bacterium]|nr:gliding motility-associated C-terminal domain-containing protein [Bacteroidales bacterium]